MSEPTERERLEMALTGAEADVAHYRELLGLPLRDSAAFRSDVLYDDAADEIERLRAALAECADRFERCILATGTDPEHATSAVQRYRDQTP